MILRYGTGVQQPSRPIADRSHLGTLATTRSNRPLLNRIEKQQKTANEVTALAAKEHRRASGVDERARADT
jgi:hypothetical protein